MVGDVAVLPRLRWPTGFGAGGGANAREAMADIERVGDLALLAVAHAVDAERDLFGDDLAHRFGETGGERLLVDRLAALARFEQRQQIGRAWQAADMGGQDPVTAGLHVCSLPR